MKQSIPFLWAFLSLAINGIGQEPKVKDIEIPLLNVGTANRPIKLTKQLFEGDTIYNLIFSDVQHNSAGRISTQGFFIFELKAFGKALQTALSIDSGYEIHFKDGTIEIMKSKFTHRRILVRFSTGTGSFITTWSNATKLVYAIKKETDSGISAVMQQPVIEGEQAKLDDIKELLGYNGFEIQNKYNTRRPHEGLGNATRRDWLENLKSTN